MSSTDVEAMAYRFAAEGRFEEAASIGRSAIDHALARSLPVTLVENLCYWHINARRLEALVRDILPLYRVCALASRVPAEREARRRAAFNIGQEALEKGGLGEAIEFFYLADMLSSAPETRHAVELFETVKKLIIEAEQAAREIGLQEHPFRYVVSSVIWGDAYIDNYMNYLIRSLLAPGNLPYLLGSPIVFSIATTAAGRARIESHPRFVDVGRFAMVRFFIFPEELTQVGSDVSPTFSFYQLYGAMDHVSMFFARALKATIFFIPVDAIMARGSFNSLIGYIRGGYDAVGVTNMVAKRETFLPAMDEICGPGPVIDIAPLDLAKLAWRHRHQYTDAGLCAPENKDFAEWPREIFWPTKDGIHVRAIFIHPLVVSERAICGDFTPNYKYVDFQFPASLFPKPEDFSRFKVIPNSSEAYMTDSTTKDRRFHTTGNPFSARKFAERNTHAKPIHRWFMQQPQFIACEPDVLTDRDPDADVREILTDLQELAPQ